MDLYVQIHLKPFSRFCTSKKGIYMCVFKTVFTLLYIYKRDLHIRKVERTTCRLISGSLQFCIWQIHSVLNFIVCQVFAGSNISFLTRLWIFTSSNISYLTQVPIFTGPVQGSWHVGEWPLTSFQVILKLTGVIMVYMWELIIFFNENHFEVLIWNTILFLKEKEIFFL